MSVLAHIFISSDDEATGYDSQPDRFSDLAQHKSITPLELSTLWALLRGVEWDVDSLDEFVCLLERDGGERLIHRLPAEMVADLARLTAERIDAVTPQWAATEELGWKPEEARPLVDDLVRLARRAEDKGRNIYLWNCV